MSSEENDSGTEVDTPSPAPATVAESDEYKMSLEVRVDNVGPCKKHVHVTVPRSDIEHFYKVTVGELHKSANVPGFRQGKAPDKLIERRFRSELADQVKQKVLIESMEQLSDENDLDPINEPNIDVENIEIPDEGDFEYEFDVEVRPDFEIPDYEGLSIERPVREITDEDVENHLQKFLSQYGQRVPYDGAAEAGDYVTLDVQFEHNGQPLHHVPEMTARIRPVLRFQDAELEGFDELMIGVERDATCEVDFTISQEAESIEMRGETVHAEMSVLEVKRLKLPELTKEFLNRIGAESEEGLRADVRETLERQVTYEQRQSTREQVLEKITESADWELPEQLVLRQVDNALRREVLEMQQAGFTSQEIQARENQIRQRALSTTRQALKEHFVLDKIATKENIEVKPSDIDYEIRYMAMQRGETPRRVRARLEKSGMIENLEAQIRERKAVDVILQRAKFEEVPVERTDDSQIEAVSHSVCGRIHQFGSAENAQAASSSEEEAVK